MERVESTRSLAIDREEPIERPRSPRPPIGTTALPQGREVDDADLPGHELVAAGIADLEAGRETIEAMLVASAADRLHRLGRAVPPVDVDEPEMRLYALVEARVGERRAHSYYNALRRRLLRYLRSAAALGDAATPG